MPLADKQLSQTFWYLAKAAGFWRRARVIASVREHPSRFFIASTAAINSVTPLSLLAICWRASAG
jgi:hypothetical protein